jgi:sugar/nucleoside kinase (ribokinase family)
MERLSVIVAGNAISETILSPFDPVVFGEKYTVPVVEGLGGSGIDYARRLLTWGADVYPILLVGDDPAGAAIGHVLAADALQGKASKKVCDYLGEREFKAPGARTLRSTILLANGRRTIFSHEPQLGDDFIGHLHARALAAERCIRGAPSAVMIGHLYGDRGGPDSGTQGGCTRMLLNRFGGSAFSLVNFGHTQLRLGALSWEDVLPRIDLFQCNVMELRLFFASAGEGQRDLPWMIDWLRERVAAVVITAGSCGAIGVCQGSDESVFVTKASPFNVLDATGAGDAFAAGLTSQLAGRQSRSFEDLCQAMSVARTWAAFACDAYGGSGPAPDDNFFDRLELADAGCETTRIVKGTRLALSSWPQNSH